LALGLLSAGGSACRRDSTDRSDLKALAVSAASLESPPPPRRHGRPVTPGTSGAAWLALSAERELLVQSKELSERCAKTFEGDDAAAHKACIAELSASRAALSAVLRTADAERGEAPAPVHPLAPADAQTRLPREFIAFCSRARAEALGSFRGDAKDAALGTCARTLEVARDFSLGGNLVAAMSVVTCIEHLAPACTKTVGAASPAAVASFATDLASVEETFPKFGTLARAELFSVQLSLCGTFLEPAERTSLGPLGRATVALAERNKPPMMEQGLHKSMCQTSVAAALVRDRAYQVPRGSKEREAVLQEGKKALDDEKVASMDLGKYEDRWDAARKQIGDLRALAKK